MSKPDDIKMKVLRAILAQLHKLPVSEQDTVIRTLATYYNLEVRAKGHE